jgi:hypothetical protein
MGITAAQFQIPAKADGNGQCLEDEVDLWAVCQGKHCSLKAIVRVRAEAAEHGIDTVASPNCQRNRNCGHQ